MVANGTHLAPAVKCLCVGTGARVAWVDPFRLLHSFKIGAEQALLLSRSRDQPGDHRPAHVTPHSGTLFSVSVSFKLCTFTSAFLLTRYRRHPLQVAAAAVHEAAPTL